MKAGVNVGKKEETLFAEKFDKWINETFKDDVWCENIQQVCIVGTPDRLICIRGKFLAVEFKKSEKDQPTAMQTYKLNKITRAGGLSLLVYPENFHEAKMQITSLLCRQLSG